MPRLDPGRGRAFIAFSIGGALVVSACGGGSTATDSATSATEVEATSTTEAATTSTSAADAAASSVTESSAADTEPVENLFPDLEVVDLADGETINLAAELGGGDRPVLLWFWAPH